MRRSPIVPLALALALGLSTPLRSGGQAAVPADEGADAPGPPAAAVPTRTDPLRAEAEAAAGLRILVSRSERRLWLRDGGITLHSAPVAVGKGGVLERGSRAWSFETPRGVRKVLSREENPVWVPPLWHYVELARERGYRLFELQPGQAVELPDGSRLEVRGARIELLRRDGHREALPPHEEIILGGTLYVPPIGTANRRIPGELGRYKLDLGDGYLIHGTPDEASVGSAATHGCLRLREADLRFLYQHVPPGTPVYIY